MRPESIFAPMSVLAIWTGLVLMLTGVRRVTGVIMGRIPSDAFRLGESPEVPPDVSLPNRNVMNLLEMPVLFYVVSIALYVTRQVAPGMVRLAWIYVGLRLVHSGIHLTYNRSAHRLIPFAASNFVLIGLWIWFIRRAL
jgi:hypothetical protein